MDTHSLMPVQAAFQQTGLSTGRVNAAGRRWLGTLAQVNPQSLRPLSSQEQEHLLTLAAMPYRDPTLSASAEAIRQRRPQAQAASNLVPTSRWRKRWLPPCEKNHPLDRL